MVEFLLIAISSNVLINRILNLKRKKMSITIQIFNELYINEQDEIVNLLLNAMSFDISISFVISLQKTKMQIGAHLANELKKNEEDIIEGRWSV